MELNNPIDETVVSLKSSASNSPDEGGLDQKDFLFLPGSLIAGQFEVLSLLGSGGMSDVYTCEDKILQRVVAIKVMRATGISNAQLMRRFQIEGKAIAKLKHENIIEIYGLHSSDGFPFLVMEHISGESLSTLIAAEKHLRVQRALRIAGQVCDGLACAHAEGVVHRDLKPDNVMVTNVGTLNEKVKILDFGIAKIKEETGKTVTSTGEIFGTPQYMSPEQAQGRPCDSRADQYALGCMVYEMLQGKPPFSGANGVSVIMAHVNEKPPSLSQANQAIPAHVVKTVEKMLAKDPENRFANISDAKEALFGKSFKTGLQLSSGKLIIMFCVLGLIAAVLVGCWYASSLRSSDTRVEPEVASERPADRAFKEWCLKNADATSFDNEDYPLFKHQLSDAALKNFEAMRGLKRIRLAGCRKITGAGFNALAGLPLIELDLSGTGLSDAALKDLENIESLKTLNLNGTDVGVETSKSLSKMNNIVTLKLANTLVNKESLPHIAKIQTLTELILNNCTVSDNIDKLLPLRLQWLSLNNCKLTKADINVLTKMNTLTSLVLNGTNITNNELSELSSMHQLNLLDVQHCPALNEASIKEFSQKNRCKLVTDLGVIERSAVDAKPQLASAQSTKNLVTNGSFHAEIGPELWKVFSTGNPGISGWRVTSGSVDVESNKSWTTVNGLYSIDLNGNEPGCIEQVIKTTPGKDYELTFVYTASPDVRPGIVPSLEVSVGNERKVIESSREVAQSHSSMHWKSERITFLASTPKTTLRFQSLTPEKCGMGLGDVAVVQKFDPRNQ